MKSTFAAICAMVFATGTVFAADPVNEKCPVSAKAVDPDETVSYTVTFCCAKCVTKFNKEPLAYAEKVASAKEGKCPLTGKAVDADATADVKIGACCGRCVKKISAEPAKFFGKLQKAS